MFLTPSLMFFAVAVVAGVAFVAALIERVVWRRAQRRL